MSRAPHSGLSDAALPGLSELLAPLVRSAESYGLGPGDLEATLGPSSWAAFVRGEPGGVDVSGLPEPAAAVLRLLYLHEPVGVSAVRAVLGEAMDPLIDAAVLLTSDSPAASVRLAVDVRPHVLNGTASWVVSDPDPTDSSYEPGPDHVPGVGAASVSLSRIVPPFPVGSVLDLGCGSGIQLLAQAGCAASLTGTDVSSRALGFARASLELSGVEAQLLTGSWFEPVAGRTFDRIVSNPPFVIGAGDDDHVYRAAGLELDQATSLVVSGAREHLAAGGQAFILGSWAHIAGQPWQQRVASWLPDSGVCAWVAQRDVVDPAHYVGTWLRDEGLDVRDPQVRRRSRRWLDYLHARDVEAIGFGYIALSALTDEPSEVVAEDLPQHIEDPLGPELAEYFHRARWLRAATPESIAHTRFGVRAGLARETVELAGDFGFDPVVTRLTRTDGPRYSHDVDTHLAAIVAGLHPQGLPLSDVVDLYCAANDLAADGFLTQCIPLVVDLVRHGLILPEALIDAPDSPQ